MMATRSNRQVGTKQKRRVGIYVRISKDRANEVSTEVQREACEKYADDKGWPIIDRYIDKGKSAYNGERRPDLERLLADVEAAVIDTVIVYRLDRITRSVSDFAGRGGIQRRLEAVGAEFVSISEGFDTSTPMGRAMVQIAVVFAELESGIKSERISDWHEHRKRTGVAPTGPRPYGYGSGHKIVPEERKVLRESARALLAGKSLRSVVAELNAKGTRTRSGAAWTPQTVKGILTSPHTAGLRAIDGVLVKGTWPALIDRATYDQLVELLSDPSRRTGPGPTPRWLLSGIARCKICGTPLGIKPNRAGPRYTCEPRRGFDACERLSIDAKVADRAVSEAIEEVLPAAPLKAAMASMVERPADVVEQLQGELAALAAMYGRGDLLRAEWEAAREPLQRRLAVAQEAVDAGQSLPVPTAAEWGSLDVTIKRAVIGTLVERVTILPAAKGMAPEDRVQLRWRA
jgi:DNA invertase Pin-like site-specific DNA recombinase